MKAFGILMVGALAVAGGIAAATYITKKKIDKENEENYYDDWDNDDIDDDWDFDFDEDMEIEDEPAAPKEAEPTVPEEKPTVEESKADIPEETSFNDVFGTEETGGSIDEEL